MPVASYVFPNTDVDDMGKIGKELYSRKKLENNLYLIKKKKEIKMEQEIKKRSLFRFSTVDE